MSVCQKELGGHLRELKGPQDELGGFHRKLGGILRTPGRPLRELILKCNWGASQVSVNELHGASGTREKSPY